MQSSAKTEEFITKPKKNIDRVKHNSLFNISVLNVGKNWSIDVISSKLVGKPQLLLVLVLLVFVPDVDDVSPVSVSSFFFSSYHLPNDDDMIINVEGFFFLLFVWLYVNR